MAELEFSRWLAQKSWRQGVRFCGVVAVLVPLVALAVDVPLLRDPVRMQRPEWVAMMIWHVIVEAVCLGVVIADRYMPRDSDKRLWTILLALLIYGLSTAFGAISWLTIGDFSIYALGSVFVATVLCTTSSLRKWMYVIGAAFLAGVIFMTARDAQHAFNAAVNPICVAVVTWQLDKYAFERNIELFAERRRAEQERERADKVLYNVFPVSIADELKRDEKVNAVKFEGMGVLFSDIVGFTSFSRMLPPDALVFVLNQIFSMFDRLVDQYNLEKIKTIGDAYMVVSNKRTDALAQLALDMLDGMAAYNAANGTDFQLRIGIHVGPAVAGVIGVKRFLYDVWGDTVNVASRMESTGEPGRVHVTQAVCTQLKDQFQFEELAPLEVKGKGVMTTYFLGRPTPLGVAPPAVTPAVA